jgi:monofunctional biosynthetic peptidoglycan transglycosylase
LAEVPLHPIFFSAMTPPRLAADTEAASWGRGTKRIKPVKQPRPARRRFGRMVALLVISMLTLPLVPIVVYRFVPPPVTPLMVIRAIGGAPLRHRFVPLAQISPMLIRAVVASEDEKFCFHHGFDWDELAAAVQDWRAGRTPRGASTISMQTAKNLFLWPGRSFLRKGIEAYLTAAIELVWSKQRIVEVYLNVIEWGDGIYGAEMAARAHFGKSAAALNVREAALLAAVLPNPRRWSPDDPTAYIASRATTIRARMPGVAVPSARGCR